MTTHQTPYDPSELAVLGEPCLYHAHSTEFGTARTWRDASTRACVECDHAIRNGQLGVSLDRLAKQYRKPALRFWQKVEITDLDSCWKWTANKGKKGLGYVWKRPLLRSNWHYHPILVAIWLTYGDVGRIGTFSRCQNRRCMNPFHNIPLNLLDTFDESAYDRARLENELEILKEEVRQLDAPAHLTESPKDDFICITKQNLKVPDPLANLDLRQYDSAFNRAMVELLGVSTSNKSMYEAVAETMTVDTNRHG